MLISKRIGMRITYALCSLLFVCSIFYFEKKRQLRAQVRSVYGVLDKYKITQDLDACSMNMHSFAHEPKAFLGEDLFKQRLSKLLSEKEPLKMILVGFPFKSGNHEKKTLGNLPDLAERKSLEFLQGFADEIKTIYPPGAEITIFTDGVPFADIFSIPLDTVALYETTLKHLAADLPALHLYTSNEFLADYGLGNRAEIVNFVEAVDGENRDSVSISPVTLKRVHFEFDHKGGDLRMKNKAALQIADELISRERKLQKFITSKFPPTNYIRLSVHLSTDLNKKYGIKLSDDSCVTPYHGVLIEESAGKTSIVFKKDVSTKDYTVKTTRVNGVPCPYFKRLNER